MLFGKIFVVFLAVMGRMCLSKIAIKVNGPDGLGELGEATIDILKTCHGNQTKALVLMGESSVDFTARLSSLQLFSVVLMNNARRNETWHYDAVQERKDTFKLHKVHLSVIIAMDHENLWKTLVIYRRSIYFNPMASLVIVGWSSVNEHTICKKLVDILRIFHISSWNSIPNAKLICYDGAQDIVIYRSNRFRKQAPESWKEVESFPLFVRKYRSDKGLCKNLDIDETRNLNGSLIVVFWPMVTRLSRAQLSKFKMALNFEKPHFRNIPLIQKATWLQACERYYSLFIFFNYVNATPRHVLIPLVVGNLEIPEDMDIYARVIDLKGVDARSRYTYTYPRRVTCRYLMTQFRGNMTQIDKIFAVLDSYSWYAMHVTSFVTLTFFIFFLHQSVQIAMLNLCRLIGNFGLPTLPLNVAPRIYIGCLLFFVVTMQGIFAGNLASLLTHDFPVRQVNSIQDAADLGYKIFVDRIQRAHFDNPAFKGRIIERAFDEDCFGRVLKDPLMACLISGAVEKDMALRFNLYIGDECIGRTYYTRIVQPHWPLLGHLDQVQGILNDVGVSASSPAMVTRKRLLEAEAIAEIEKESPEPEVMVLADLDFAFAILGAGLACAAIAFVVELIIDEYKDRARTTRVIVL